MIAVCDTETWMPLASMERFHYGTMTDLSWSCDGRHLIMTSADGFATMATFAPGELGDPLSPEASHKIYNRIRDHVRQTKAAATTAEGPPSEPASEADKVVLLSACSDHKTVSAQKPEPDGIPRPNFAVAVHMPSVKRKLAPILVSDQPAVDQNTPPLINDELP